MCITLEVGVQEAASKAELMVVGSYSGAEWDGTAIVRRWNYSVLIVA